MEKQQVPVGNIQLTVYVLEDDRWALSDEMVATALGIKEGTVRRHFQKYKDVFIEGHHWNLIGLKRHWTKEGLIKLGNYVTQEKAGILLDALGVQSRHVTRIESNVTAIVSASLAGIVPIHTQHHVEGYKVDIYIPSLKLAIEIDEYGHEGYDPLGEIFRELIISKTRDCEFIRWNAHAHDANVGTLINEVLRRFLASTADVNEA